MEQEQDFFSNLTPTSGGLIIIGIGLLLLRPTAILCIEVGLKILILKTIGLQIRLDGKIKL